MKHTKTAKNKRKDFFFVILVLLSFILLFSRLEKLEFDIMRSRDTLGERKEKNTDHHDHMNNMHDTRSSSRIAVFYNVFTASASDIDFVRSIVKEQLNHLRPEHEVFVRSIGTSFDIENTTLLQHDSTGDEIETLSLLWDYCKKHPDKKVVYIHTKGSFHNHKSNTKLRKFLTRGALSEQCANLPSSCNVCSSRMSPIPHPHTSGNMWLARCNYINRLMTPQELKTKMSAISHSKGDNACIGTGRYASEHWVHSHPSVMPCDLSTDRLFNWSYENVPDEDFEIDLQPSPRFKMEVYRKEKICGKLGTSLKYRLDEYNALYSENVTDSWWGWKFFPIENDIGTRNK